MKQKFKGIITAALIFTMALGNVSTTFAASKLYNEVTSSKVTKGVDYIYDHRLTDAGFQNVNVLKIDLGADNIKLAPVESVGEYGKKETVLKMVNDNGAIAGVNADFFGLKGNYSASFGPVVKDGELISAGTDRNLTSNEYASFFLKEDGNAFLQFFKFNIEFLANGTSHFELASANKITEMIYPIYFDRKAAANTKDLDARFQGLVKLVVENGKITYISQKGETVNVPENGYLIILSSAYADAHTTTFAVGQTAEVKINASVNLDTVKMAIGGAGLILENGNPSNAGMVISGRQPRTALGISQDQKTLILMVVDGRGTSIGATPEEMAALMKEYGAYNAMHLDGGGSSTMVVKESDEDQVTVKNQVSEGSERKVMNGLGVFDTAPVSDMTELVITPSAPRVFVGDTITFSAFGYDEYYHKLPVNVNEVIFSTVGGTFTGNTYKAEAVGEVEIFADYKGIVGTTKVDVMEMASITPDTSSIMVGQGGSATINVSGLSTEGFTGKISSGVTYELSNPALGTMNGNVFVANNTNGTGFIKCTFNGLNCYVRVAVGGQERGVSSFDNVGDGMTFSSSPAEVKGSVASVGDVVINGSKSLQLKYSFLESTSTQAAYLKFKNPVEFKEPATQITMAVNGNGSGDWIRAKLIDADGNTVVLDFTKDMNWTGWKDLTATVPANTKFPAVLDTIYVASLTNTNTKEQKINIDYLRAVMPVVNNDEIPADTKIPDAKRTTMEGKQDGSYYVNIIGGVTSGVVEDKNLYTSARNTATNAVEANTDLAIYGGKSDIQSAPKVDTIKWSSTYGFHKKNGVDIVQLTAANGGLRNTFAAQWSTFKNDVMNSQSKNVIFVMNRTPSDFTDIYEAALFKSALSDIRKAGKTVFVVSSSGTSSWDTMKDGIRYINLPELWNGKNLNKNFKVAKFKVTDGEITFDIQNVF